MWICFIIIIIIVLLSGLGFAGWKLSGVVIDPEYTTVEDALKAEIDNKVISRDWYDALDKEKILINSKQGYGIDCELIKSHTGGKRVVILCHGFSFNRVAGLKYSQIFLDNGFDVIIYDHRACGYSGGKYTTMGYYESQDLSAIIDWVYKNYGEDCIIGTHGESMGATTVLLNCARDCRVNFAIADCGFSDLKKQLAYRLKVEFKIPAFPFLQVSSFVAKLRANFWFKDVSPIREIQKRDGLPNMPILFIHGSEDDYVLTTMCKEMYDIKKGKKAMYIAKGANHVGSFGIDREEYRRQIEKFLKDFCI